jgi:hypothetical protein
MQALELGFSCVTTTVIQQYYTIQARITIKID